MIPQRWGDRSREMLNDSERLRNHFEVAGMIPQSVGMIPRVY